MTDVTERIMKLLEKIAVKESTETAAKLVNQDMLQIQIMKN